MDYFLLFLYRFVCFLRKDDLEEYSARLFLSAYVWFLFLVLYWGMGFVGGYYHMDREIIAFMHEYGEPISFTTAMLIAIVINLYYTKFRHLSDIEMSYNSLSKEKRIRVKVFIWIIVIALPLCAFACGRLFFDAQVK